MLQLSPLEVPEMKKVMKSAIKKFAASLPNLKTMRDVAEHIDEYSVDKGRDTAVRRQALEVAMFNDSQIQWLGFSLDTDLALRASENLFEAIKSYPPSKVP